jgi:hypothetical protein
LGTLYDYLKNTEKKFDAIKGLGWIDNGNVKFNGPSESLHLDGLPIPEFEYYFHRLEDCSPNF